MAVAIRIVKIIRKTGAILLGTWRKIKKFFGFSDCGDYKRSYTGEKEGKEEKIKIKIKEEDLQGIQEPPYIYKLEPSPKEEKEELESTSSTSSAPSNTKRKPKRKPKRSWYNNGEKQQLVTSEEASKLPKTWKKGKLPKTSKTPKTPKTPKKDK